MANATDPRIATASGRAPAVEDGPTPTEETRPDGQKADHWVLSDEERAKGLIRPVRLSYRHVGVGKPKQLRELSDEEKERYAQFKYVAFEPYGEDRAPVTGRYWTQEQLDRADGCGQETRMPVKCAETYAAQPNFYGSTFCCHCQGYFPVGAQGEFVWLDDGTRVGT